MEQKFEEYLKQARKNFAKVAAEYSVDEHLELRTAIDSLLIAYDQATDKALSIANFVGRSEQLADDVVKFERKSKPMIAGDLCHPNIDG